MNKIKAIIIDDEKPARERIRFMLDDYPDIVIISECKNGLEAVKKIESLKPDLIFLDIQMPGLDGFEVLANLDQRSLPIIIFVTAYDNFAVKAFDINALDYLLKPFSKKRFSESIDRLVKIIENRSKNSEKEKYLKLPSKSSDYKENILIKNPESIELINISDIDFIKSAGNYIEINKGSKKYLKRTTMTAFEKELDPKIFVRVHRYFIINIFKIKKLKPLTNQDHLIILKNNSEITLSRRYKDNFEEIFGEL